MSTIQLSNLLNIRINDVVLIARKAASTTMKCISSGLQISIKEDGSKVTNADLESNSIVTSGLSELTQDIPILSEESHSKFDINKLTDTFWCVDPLDGTNTMISYSNGNKERIGFTINIALVHKGKPIKGIVYYPTNDEVYYTGDDDKAYKMGADLSVKVINAVKASNQGPLKVAVRHKKENRPKQIAGREVEYIPEVGGKSMLSVANASSDVAWLNFKTSPWDIAAPHAILRAAGGDLINEDNRQDMDYTNTALTMEPAIGAHLDTLIELAYKK